MKQGMIIAGFAVLSAVALAGWVRKPAVTPASLDQATTAGYNTPAALDASAPATYSTLRARPAYYQEAAPEQRVVTREYAPTRTVTVRHRRPFSHSAAIVAGSAGFGAAIGALAGGGKGAGIGALSGGAAGFIYDRLTHNR